MMHWRAKRSVGRPEPTPYSLRIDSGSEPQVEQFGDLVLHAEGQLERLDRAFDLGVIYVALELGPVEIPNEVELRRWRSRDIALALSMFFIGGPGSSSLPSKAA